MNILILNWRDIKHPLAGGAEQMVFEHAKYWQKKGEKITWFASSFKNAKNEEVIDGIKIIRKGNHFTVSIWAFIYSLRGKFKDALFVVDCFHFFPYFSVIYMRKTPKVALIQEVAGSLWFENLLLPIAVIGFLLEPYIIRMYKNLYFITGSESAKRDLVSLDIKREKVVVINHGFNRGKIKIIRKEKNPTLIFLGRISKDKGIEDALMSVKFLLKEYPNLKLWIVGKSESKEYERKIKRKIMQLKINKNCEWFGFVTESKKNELLSRAFILIHPSRREGWGINIIEANYLGTPAVGYSVAGLTDSIVHNKTGLLVEPDARSLANGVEKLLRNPKIYKKMSKNSRAWSEKFNWKDAGEKSFNLIQKIYGKKSY